jgi:hypothetical protein
MNVYESSLLCAASVVAIAALSGCGAGGAAPAQPSVSGASAATRVSQPSGSFNGSWPFTVTKSKYSNGTHCVALTTYDSGNFKYSGTAIVDGKERGGFAVIGPLIEITTNDGGYSQNAGSVYSATLEKSGIGTGAFVEVYGGGAFDEGKIVFGKRGSC